MPRVVSTKQIQPWALCPKCGLPICSKIDCTDCVKNYDDAFAGCDFIDDDNNCECNFIIKEYFEQNKLLQAQNAQLQSDNIQMYRQIKELKHLILLYKIEKSRNK